MRSLSKSTFIWLTLLVTMLVLVVAAPLATAAGPALRAAPLSAEFLRYQADLKLRHTLGLDRVPGFRPGLVPAPMDVSSLQGARSAPPLATYAASYDLRTLGRVTAVKDQAPYGTCWSFASLGSLESGLLPGETADFSEDNLVLNSGFDLGGTAYEDGGNYSMSTAYLVRWGGPVNEGDDAYGDGSTPASLTPRKHVQEVNWIPARGSALDNDSVKSAVTLYGGVYVSMEAEGMSTSSSYYNAATSSYYYNVPGTDTNHAVLIVGWDDTYARTRFATDPGGNGAFIVKNSWGTSWGSNGYFYVSYYDTRFGRDGLMAVFDGAQSASNYGSIYQYDPLGDCGSFGYSSSTGWFANVFTADSTASLGAVGFYTVAPDTSYEVYTGSSLATKTLSASGSFAYMGYHTVTLPSSVGITSGQQFAVVVKVTSSSGGYPIAFEAPYTGYSGAATAQAGQSFVSSSGSNWTDLTTVSGYSNANVCLKAYTTGSGSPPTPDPTLTPTPGDTVGPACAARNVAVNRGRTCRVKFRVHDALSAQVTTRLLITTRSGAVKKRWAWGYDKNSADWWYTKYRCRLRRGTYRIVVTGTDLAGNGASVVGRATLKVK